MTQVNGTNALMIQIHDAGLRLDRTGHQPTQVTTARMPRPRSHLVSHYMSEQRSGNSVTYSRLKLTWANGVWREWRPRVNRAQPTLSGPRVSGSAFCRGWQLSAPAISRVRSWSSPSRVRSFFALSNRGWYSASSAGVSRRVMVLPPILRVHSAYGPCSRGGSAWQRQPGLP